MIVQLDTNILTRLAQPSHPLHPIVLSAMRRLESAGHVCCIVPQNLFDDFRDEIISCYQRVLLQT